MKVEADPATEAVNACVREVVGELKDRVVVDTFVETKLKGVSDDSLSSMRIEQLKEMHRRLNEDLNDPIPLPATRLPYARNEKALLVDSLVQIRTRLSRLAGPSEEAERAPKRGKADGAGQMFIPASIQQPDPDSRAAPKHAAIRALSNSQEEYLANLNRYQHGKGKEVNRFKKDVQLAVTGFFSRVPQDRPAEVEQAIRSSLLDPDEYAANDAKYGKAVAVLKTQLERIMKNPKAPLLKVPASALALFKRVETSLVDRKEVLNKVLEQVQANLAMVQRPYKDKRSGCVLEITRLAYNKKRAAFLDPDNAHHKATRMAAHLAIVGMKDVRTELIEAATIDGQALAERRDAYHNKQHPEHAKVYALVEAELERRRAERGIPAPKPRNLVGEVEDVDSDTEKEMNADVQTLHEARKKARQEILMRYPNFNKFATESLREQAERKQKQQAAAEAKAEAARKAAAAATLKRHKTCTEYVLFKADLTEQRVEAAKRAKVIDQTTSEWL
jgi:hypothetical protein